MNISWAKSVFDTFCQNKTCNKTEAVFVGNLVLHQYLKYSITMKNNVPNVSVIASIFILLDLKAL